jgi:DNA polymerase III epsilon subunit family exonuclease
MSVPGPIVGKVTTSSSVPEARGDAWPDVRADGAHGAPSGEPSGAPEDVLFETCLYLEQGALEGLARPLTEIEFVVVDLETTGGSPAEAAITEIGAVRTRGTPGYRPGRPGSPGAGLGGAREFATLVNPGRAIPPHVAALTGITDALVTAAPRVEDVLPRFIEFAAGSVLVAHNAPFDIAFLRAACERHNLAWPALPTLDTAALARRMLTTDEVHDCRLGTLADFFAASTQPNHRALDDARATAAVLHGLLERLARRGVHTLEALRGFGVPAAPQRRRMRQLTAAIPRTPGVCVFTATDGQVLHVVRSSDMHARASGYFTAAETRGGVRDMIDKTARIVPIPCATPLEAEVTEIRLTAVHLPPYGGDSNGAHGAATTGHPSADGARPGHPTTDGTTTGHPTTDGANAGHLTADGDADPPSSGLLALAAVRKVVAARPRFSGGWDVAWIGHGLLEATAVVPRGAGLTGRDQTARSPIRCAIRPEWQAATAAGATETACLLSWLESPGVRLIAVEGTWSIPLHDARVG